MSHILNSTWKLGQKIPTSSGMGEVKPPFFILVFLLRSSVSAEQHIKVSQSERSYWSPAECGPHVGSASYVILQMNYWSPYVEHWSGV